jgi:hypothetical protein
MSAHGSWSTSPEEIGPAVKNGPQRTVPLMTRDLISIGMRRRTSAWPVFPQFSNARSYKSPNIWGHPLKQRHSIQAETHTIAGLTRYA